MNRLLLAALLLAACPRPHAPALASAPASLPASAPASAPTAAPPAAEFRPSGPAAERYGVAAAFVPTSPLEVAAGDAVLRAAAAAGVPAPVLDERLAAVARDLAAGGGALPPPDSVIDHALSFHGIPEPSPALVVVRDAGGDPSGLADELARRLVTTLAPGFERAGVGAAVSPDGSLTLVLAFQDVDLALEPLPRRLAVGERAPLRGEARAPYTSPEVYVTGVDGAVARTAVVHVGAAGFRSEVVCAVVGRLGVEVIGHDVAGAPVVLANFPIFCGVDPPAALSLVGLDREGPVTDVTAAEHRLFDLVNADRAAAGLAPLEWLEPAAAIARAHSADMNAHDFVGHVSPTTGNAADRCRAAGISSSIILENVARSYSVAEAEKGLMNSPGHRGNILSPEVTHLGVGISLGPEAAGAQALLVTQLFVLIAPPADLAAERERVHAAVAAARRAAKLGRLTRDAKLDEAAGELAARLAANKATRGDIINDGAHSGDGRFEVVAAVVLVGASVDAIADSKAAHRPGARAVGAGVGQGNDPDLGEGVFFVVLLVGE